MNNGYIKLHRKLLSCSIFRNKSLLQLWIWCLLKAAHEEHEVVIGNQKVNLLPGQFIYGRHVASDDLGTPASTVWRELKKLEELEMLSINSTNKYSVVTIANWASYQSEPEKVKNKRKTSANEMDTYKNEKNEKNIISDKNKIPPTLEMVTKYCLDENYPINPQAFIDYYESRGWKVGSQKMKDWQATVRNWARREGGTTQNKPQVEVKKYMV